MKYKYDSQDTLGTFRLRNYGFTLTREEQRQCVLSYVLFVLHDTRRSSEKDIQLS